MYMRQLKEIKADGLITVINTWFYSDFDISFMLKKGKEILECVFESDVWYQHINDSVRGVTIKSIRHDGNKRRLIGVYGSDAICNEIFARCQETYTKDELIDLVKELSLDYKIMEG